MLNRNRSLMRGALIEVTAMPLTRLTCPKCRAVLKPAKPVPEGKTIKCPKCEELFKAGEAPGAARGSSATTAKKPAETAAAKATDDDDEGEMYAVIRDEEAERKKAQAEEREARKRRIARMKRRGEEVDEEELEAAEEDDDQEYDLLKHYLESVKTKDPRGPAQERVVTPSNWLLRTGLIGFFGWAIVLIVFLIPVAFPNLHDDDPSMQKEGAAEKAPTRGKSKDKEEEKKKVQELDLAETIQQHAWSVVVFVFVLILGLAQGAAIAYGAVKMQSLESWNWSLVACILTFLPLYMVPFWVFTWWFFERFLFDEMQWAPACLVFAWAPLVGGLCLKMFLNPVVKLGFTYKAD
jgi:hypothetical protein